MVQNSDRLHTILPIQYIVVYELHTLIYTLYQQAPQYLLMRVVKHFILQLCANNFFCNFFHMGVC